MAQRIMFSLLAAIGIVAVSGWVIFQAPPPSSDQQNALVSYEYVNGTLSRENLQNDRVLVELFTMSMCPDAFACIETFKSVLKQVDPITKMSIHYVGEVLPTKIVCRHGELECFNNAVQLCVRHVYNEQSAGTNLSPNGWFNFVTCISDWDSLLNVQKPEGPGIVENCVRKTGIADFKGATEEIFKCSEGAEGHALLEGSVRTTISRGVTKSCTVHVNRKQRCIFDGGRMYQCSPDSEPASFVRTICQEWGGSSEICHKTN